MKSRYKYLAIVALCGFLTPFCYSDDDNCGGFSSSYFDIEGLELNEFIQDSRPYLTNNIADTTFEFTSDADVILDLTYVVEYVSEANPTNVNWGELFNPSLLACSPIPPGSAGSKEERHAGMEVRTLFDYTSALPAGSIINDEVLVGDYPSGTINSSLDSLVRDTGLIQQQRLAILIPLPSAADTMQLQMNLSLSTGEMYEVTTPRFVYPR